MKLHRLRAFFRFPRACASIRSRLFSLLRRFLAAKTAQLSETLRESVYSGSPLKTGCATPRVKKRFFTRHLLASFLLRVKLSPWL
jgi:type VI protein secretion system component VasK